MIFCDIEYEDLLTPGFKLSPSIHQLWVWIDCCFFTPGIDYKIHFEWLKKFDTLTAHATTTTTLRCWLLQDNFAIEKKRLIADLFWNLIHSKRIFIPFSHLRSPPCKVAVLYDINNQLRDARFDLCGICLFVHLPSFSNLFYLCSSVLNCLVSFSLYFSSFHSYFLSLYLQKNIIKFETNQIHFSL